MTKSSEPRTEPWGKPQEDVYQDDRSVSHLTRKQRNERYDLNQLRTEPWTPNQDDRRMIKMSWTIVSKACSNHSQTGCAGKGHVEQFLVGSCVLLLLISIINTHQESVFSSVFERKTVGTVLCYFYAILAHEGLTS